MRATNSTNMSKSPPRQREHPSLIIRSDWKWISFRGTKNGFASWPRAIRGIIYRLGSLRQRFVDVDNRKALEVKERDAFECGAFISSDSRWRQNRSYLKSSVTPICRKNLLQSETGLHTAI